MCMIASKTVHNVSKRFSAGSMTHHETPMDPAPPQIRGVLRQIHRPEPLHHSVIGPQRHLSPRLIRL